MASLLIGTACQSVKPIDPAMPIVIEGLFINCQGRDDSLNLTILEGSKTLISSEIDWSSKLRDGWAIEAYSPFGQTLATVKANLSLAKLRVSIPNLDGAKLSTDTGGRILYEGHYIGVNLDEVPCMLSGRLPSLWKRSITAYKKNKNSYNIEISSHGRNIKITIDEPKVGPPSFCAHYSWSEYIGVLSHSLEYCHLEKNISKTLISLSDDLVIRLKGNPRI